MGRDRRVLPHNIEAEASILGGILLRNEVLSHLASTLKPFSVIPGDAIFREGEPAREIWRSLRTQANSASTSCSARSVATSWGSSAAS